MRYQSGSVYSKTVTATNDLPFRVEQEGSEEGGTILSSVNIHCYTNPSYYGALGVLASQIQPNAVVWFDGTIRVSDLVFKNVTGGSNTQIVITGIVK